MNLLLDTHTWLWLLHEPEELTAHALSAVTAGDASLHLSVASLWEIAIKVSVHKLTLASSVQSFLPMAIARSGVKILGISTAHVIAVADLPAHHRDPFDRMLIVQARAEGLTLVSRDPALGAYDVPVLWE